MIKTAFLLLSVAMLSAMGERPSLPSPVYKPELLADCDASDKGLKHIQEYEGFVPFIYKDVGGLGTIGFGHLVQKGEKFPEPFLPEHAEELLRKDVGIAAGRVNKAISAMLQQRHCDALISFAFNIGVLKAAAPTLVQFVNQERHDDAAKQFLVYNKVRINGKLTPVKGLTRRREAESRMYRGD